MLPTIPFRTDRFSGIDISCMCIFIDGMNSIVKFVFVFGSVKAVPLLNTRQRGNDAET